MGFPGLSTSLPFVKNNGGESKPYAPIAFNSGSPTGNSFTAAYTAGSNNTGTYFLDVFYQGNFMGMYNNTSVSGLFDVVVLLSGLQNYTWQVRAALNVINLPPVKADSDYQHIVNLSPTTGADIQTAINAITDSTQLNQYLIIIANGSYDCSAAAILNSNKWISFRAQTDHGVFLYNHNASSSISIFEFNGNFSIQGIDFDTTGHRWAVHTDYPETGTFVIRNCHMTSHGDTWGMGTGFSNAQRGLIINCHIHSDLSDAFFVHNPGVAQSNTGGSMFVLSGCTLTTGVVGGYGVVFDLRNNPSGANDLMYISGGSCSKVKQLSEGTSPTCKYYVDPALGATIVLDPTTPISPLDNAGLTTFLTINPYSVSSNSNLVSVTTASEGTKALDNMSGKIQGAWSLLDQLKTVYGGQLSNTTTDGTGITIWNDQSYNVRNAINGSGNGVPVYTSNGIDVGLPALASVAGISTIRSQLSLSSFFSLGTDFDMIAIVKISANSALFNDFNAPMMLMVTGLTYSYLSGGSGPTIFGAGVSRNSKHIVNIRKRGTNAYLIVDGTVVATNVVLANLVAGFQYLLNSENGDNTTGFISEMVAISNAVAVDVDAYVANRKTRIGI